MDFNNKLFKLGLTETFQTDLDFAQRSLLVRKMFPIMHHHKIDLKTVDKTL